MIVKLWPVKGSQGALQCFNYIGDKEKVIKEETGEVGAPLSQEDVADNMDFDGDIEAFSNEEEHDIERVLRYMGNEDKTENKYISGYLCNPENALLDFASTWAVSQDGVEHTAQLTSDEVLSFHLVQSFPEDLVISNEEVHQCGIELLEKIQKHQGVVCSHVHAVVDEDGEVHGKAKHNHILFNAYIEPSQIDPEHPERRKYNDCTTTYRQLQIWNDEIAIDHGLPIIQEPDLMRTSWKENTEARYERSWKQLVKWDIDHARREANNWDEFVGYMEKAGYTLRDGKELSYHTPYSENRIRAKRLGQEFTKESLELFWVLRDKIDAELLAALKGEKVPVLFKLSQQHQGPLTVDVPLGPAGKEEKKYYPLPLIKADRSREVLSTYFNAKELYDVRDASGAFVSKATGQEVVSYLDALRRDEEELFLRLLEEEKEKEQARLREEWELAEEKEYKRKKREEEAQKGRARTEYYISQYKNTRTGQPYEVYLYDKNGRKRTSLDLMFMLAITIIKDEGDLWDIPNPPPEKIEIPTFGPRDWKTQNMLDAYHTAREEGVSTTAEIAERLQQLGANYSRARKAVEKTERALKNMSRVAAALEDYEATHVLVERIEALPESEEKEQLMKQYEQDIARCRSAKSTLYASKILTNTGLNNEAVLDFRWRREDMETNLPQMQQRLDEAKEAYRRMKKLQYQTQLAENKFFCYGPAYSPERAEQRRDLGEKASEKEFNNYFREN